MYKLEPPGDAQNRIVYLNLLQDDATFISRESCGRMSLIFGILPPLERRILRMFGPTASDTQDLSKSSRQICTNAERK